MKCITLSSGKQVCFDSTPKAQPGLKATSSRFNFPLSKEEQLMQQARAQGDMPVAPGVVKAKEKIREQEAVKKKLSKQPTVKLSAAQKKAIDAQGLKQDVLAEQIRRNQQSLSNPDDRSIEADIAQDLNENGVLGLLDAPLKGATALVTGRYQTPSQAIGRWANQNNHQMLRNAMIDDQFNPTGLGMVADFGGELGLGLATGKVLGKASTLTPSLVKNSDDIPSNSGFYNLDKDPNVTWTKLTKEEAAALEKNNPNLFKVEQVNEYSPEKIKQIKDAQQKQVNLALDFTEKWGYQNADELNRLEAHATSLHNQLQNATDANSRSKIVKELLDTRQQIKDGKFIDPTFKEKVTKLFEEGNIANANSYMLDDPMYGPGLRDRSKLVYVDPNDPSINNLSVLDQDYVMNNFDKIGGVRTNDATITIGSKPISTHYRKDTLTPNNQTKSEYILKQKTNYTPINDTGFVGAHEGGHDLQNPFNWVEFFQEHDPKYNYYVGHDRNPVASRFKNAMIEPTLPGPDGRHTNESWLSGIGELHSNLMGERFKEVKDLMDYEGMSMDDAIKLLKKDPDPLLTRLINSDNSVSRHFKPDISNEEKLNLLRMLPALGVGALGVGAAAKSVGAKEPVQKVGGKNINTTGYLDNSDTKHNPYNIIPSNNITMDGVSIPLMLMPDGDQARVVMPNSGEYNFPNSQYVTEIPLAQKGRKNNKKEFNPPISKERQLAEQARMQGDIAAQNRVLPKEAVKVNAIAKEKIKQQQQKKAQEDFYSKGRTELNEGKADIRTALERKLADLNLEYDLLEQQGRLAPGFRDFQNMGSLDKALFLMGSAFEPMGGGKAGFVKNGKFISVEPNQINTYLNSGKLGQTARNQFLSLMLSRSLNNSKLPVEVTPEIRRIDPINRSSVNVKNDFLKNMSEQDYNRMIQDIYHFNKQAFDNPVIQFKSSKPVSSNFPLAAKEKEGLLFKEKFCLPGSECAKTSNAVTNKIYTDITGKSFNVNDNAHNAWHLEDQMTRHGAIPIESMSDLKVGDRLLMGNGVDQSTYFPGYTADPNIRHAGTYAGLLEYNGKLYQTLFESGEDNPLFLNSIYTPFTGPNTVQKVFRPKQFIGNEFGENLVDKNIRYSFRDKPSVATYSSQNKKVQSIIDNAEQHREQIKKMHDLTNDEFDEMMLSLIGIGAQETKLNATLPGSKLSKAKINLQNILTDLRLTKPIKKTINEVKDIANKATSKSSNLPDYPGASKIEMESAILAKDSNIPFSEALTIVKSKYQPKPKFIKSTVEPSKGMFRQKFTTDEARTSNLKNNIFNDEVGHGLSQMAENYNIMKKMYPEATPRELIDLTTLMWNSPGKVKNKELVDFFLFGNNNPDPNKFKFDYLTKVKNQRNKLIDIQPKSVEDHTELFRNRNYPEIQYQPGGQAVKKGPGPFLIPEARPQFKSMPVPNRQDPRFMAYQDSVIQNNKSIQALQDFNKAYNTKQPYVATPENLTDDYKNSGVKQQGKYTNPKNTKNYLQPSKKIDDLNEEQRTNLVEAFNTQQEGTPINLPTALYYADLFNNSTYRNEDIWFDYHTNPVQPYHVEPMELMQSKTVGPISTSFERPAPAVPQITPYTPTGKGFSPKTEGLTVQVPTVEVWKEKAAPFSNAVFRQNKINPDARTKLNISFDLDRRELINRSKLDSLRESIGLEPKGYQKGGKTIKLSSGKIITFK